MLFPATEQNQATSAKNIGDSLGFFQEKECGTTTVITVYMAIYAFDISSQSNLGVSSKFPPTPGFDPVPR